MFSIHYYDVFFTIDVELRNLSQRHSCMKIIKYSFYMIVYIYFNCSALHNSRINEGKKTWFFRLQRKFAMLQSFAVLKFNDFTLQFFFISILLCTFSNTLTFLDQKLIFFFYCRHLTSCIITNTMCIFDIE